MESDRPDRPPALEPEQRYALLEAAAVRLDVRIRLESLSPEEELSQPRGGLIRLGGERIVMLDKGMPLERRIGVLARGLNRVLEERGQGFGYLPPAVRRILQEAEEEGLSDISWKG